MGFFSRFKFRRYINNAAKDNQAVAAADDFSVAPQESIIEKADGVQYKKNAKGAWDKIGTASTSSSGSSFRRTFSKGLGAHGYGSAAEWRRTCDIVNLSTHTVARGNDSTKDRYYGAQGNSWETGTAYAFGGHIDGVTKWNHSTNTASEVSHDFYDNYQNGTTSNGQDKSYIGSRNGSEQIQKYVHSTDTITRKFIGLTQNQLSGGWSDMDNRGYMPTDSSQVSKYAMSTDTRLINNVSHGNHTSHDQASSHEGEYAFIQTDGNATDNHRQYNMSVDQNKHIADSSYHTGEGTMAGANTLSYIIGGYSSSQGGSYGQHQYIERFDIMNGTKVYTGTCCCDRSSGVGAAY